MLRFQMEGTDFEDGDKNYEYGSRKWQLATFLSLQTDRSLRLLGMAIAHSFLLLQVKNISSTGESEKQISLYTLKRVCL